MTPKCSSVECQQTRQEWCYSLTTGDPLWGPTIQLPPMGYYATGGGSGIQGNVYYGIYLGMNAANYHGQIYAYNATTGNLLWIYNATATYPYESMYGNNMPLMLGAVCDGKVYVYSTEHSPTNPLWRQAYLRCINITDGTLIWKLEDYQNTLMSQGPAIADGYIVTCSQYDNLIYCIGKGPSATTVSAPQTVPTLGYSVMITGSVTDQSPGATAYAHKFGVTNGVAAVSDESQEAWMEYLYEQQSKPSNATGVPVTLTAIDPNNNYIPIGTTTTDLTGAYGYMFTPQVPGTYRIIATFGGSSSYGGSSAQTYIGVGDATSTASPYPVAAQPPTEMYFAISTIAIIAAIAIVGALVLIAVRKRP